VLTIESGLCLRAARVEGMVLITKDDRRLMTGALPRDVESVGRRRGSGWRQSTR
jgi:hypothetical protein